MKTKKMILMVVASSVMGLFAANASAAEWTELGWITQVAVGNSDTYVYTHPSHLCQKVKVPRGFEDHDRILDAALTAMSLGMRAKFLVEGTDPCTAVRISIEK